MTSQTSIKLLHYINARYPIIAVRTWEASRVIEEIAQVAAASNGIGKTLLTWTLSRGLREIDYSQERVVEKEVGNAAQLGLKEMGAYATPQGALKACLDLRKDKPTLVVAYNFHHYVKAPDVQQLILDVADRFTIMPHTLILIGPIVEFPRELSKAITILDWPLPDAATLADSVDAVAGAVKAKWNLPVEISNRNAIVRALQGMTLDEAQGAMSYQVATLERFDDSQESIHMLTERKAEAIKQAAALEYWPANESMSSVGGLELLKQYAAEAAVVYSEEAEAFGAQPPRGCLLVGLPGTGKSLMAKAIANEFGVPLVRLDMGAVFAGLVGASEERMRVALETVEAIAPCVLMLDEVDKGGGGGGGERSDGGTGQRVLATLLTWMQEKARKAKVFCALTANNVESINPALFRRVDQFYVGLPGADARAEILRIHLRKSGRDPEALGIDVDGIAASIRFYSGGELEEAVLSAIRKAFLLWRGEQDVTGELLLASIAEIRPVAVTMQRELAAMVEWGKTARQASVQVSEEETYDVRAGVVLPDSI